MSFGLKLTNNFGEELLSQQGMYFIKNGYPKTMVHPSYTENRTPISWNHSGFEPYSLTAYQTAYTLTAPEWTSYTKNLNTGFVWNQNSFGHDGLVTQTHTTNHAQGIIYYYGKPNYFWQQHAIPDTASGEGIIFFELPPNGLHHFNQWWNPHSNRYDGNCVGLGCMAVPVPYSTSNYFLKYLVATTVKPELEVSDYGMTIFDPNGDVTYDSRYLEQPLQVREGVKITKAQINDVMNNGASYDFPLRHNYTNPYISGNFPPSGKFHGVSRVAKPVVKLVSGNTLRIERHIYYAADGAQRGDFQTYAWGADCTVILADLT